MRRIWAFWALLLAGPALFGQNLVTPFVVSKVAPSGQYTPAEFQVIWSSFRRQYRMESPGVFVPYRFSEMFFGSAESGYNNITDLKPVLALFARSSSASGNAANVTGDQRSRAPRSIYKSADEAEKVVLKWGCPAATLDVQVDRSVTDRVSYKATSVGEGAPLTMPFLPSYPGRVQVGQQIMPTERSTASGASTWMEVRELPDDKACRDHFMTALKGGATFKVYTLRDVTCQNCGGLGTIAANGGTTEAMRKSVRGSNALDQKCTFCGGDGKAPVGRLHLLVWDRPRTEHLKFITGEGAK